MREQPPEIQSPAGRNQEDGYNEGRSHTIQSRPKTLVVVFLEGGAGYGACNEGAGNGLITQLVREGRTKDQEDEQ
jgi:hypothetical protein